MLIPFELSTSSIFLMVLKKILVLISLYASPPDVSILNTLFSV